MKGLKNLILLLFAFSCFRCSPYHVVTTWKVPDVSPRPYGKILVVGIVKDTNLQLRRTMEAHLVSDLQELGYTAVSALDEFGPKGLANMAQEKTYLTLCNKGIDGVITIALIDKHKEQTTVPSQIKYQSNLYYYNRIWNYQKIQADLQALPTNNANTNSELWESIFFDLATLEPVYIIRSKAFDFNSVKDQSSLWSKSIAAYMVKHKVLYRQQKETEGKFKAF